MEGRSLLVRDLAANELEIYNQCQTEEDRMQCLERIRALRHAFFGGGFVEFNEKNYGKNINFNLRYFAENVFKLFSQVVERSSNSDVQRSLNNLAEYLRKNDVHFFAWLY